MRGDLINMKKITVGWLLKNNHTTLTVLLAFLLLSSTMIFPIAAEDNGTVDLKFVGIFGITGDLREGSEHIIKATIINDGTKNITLPFIVSLIVDGKLVPESNVTLAGLIKQKPTEVNITWQATLGDHTLTVFVDYGNIIDFETEENNNYQKRDITINERDTDLTFQPRKIYYPRTLRAAQNNTLYTNIINLGKNTTKKINVTFYVDGKWIQSHHIDGLSKNIEHNISFQWKPATHGTYNLNITIDPLDSISNEYNETNNFLEKTVVVNVAYLKWWNSSWHYRKFYDIIGEGNISVDVNFSAYLTDLGIPEKTIENDTITIIRYHKNGTLEEPVTNYTYNETSQKITWHAQNAYYCIYFDVKENIGTRKPTSPIPFMNASGNPQLLLTAPPEGWQIIQNTELPLYFEPEDTFVFSYTSICYANQLFADFYFNETLEDTVDFETEDNLSWTVSYELPRQRGDWTMQIKAEDHAGYQPERITNTFYVGYPDLIMDSIQFTPAVTEEDPFYQGSQLTITATTHSDNTSVENVNITLFIDDQYIASYDNVTVNETTPTTVTFKHDFNQIGTFNISVQIDPADEIEELTINEDNNEQWKLLTVHGIPDLLIEGIYLKNQTVDEGDPVTVSTVITNAGTGNATNYQVALHFEQHDDEIMEYADPKSSTTFTVNINESKNISLIWSSAEFGNEQYKGKWITGIQIIIADNKPVQKPWHNSRELYKPRLTVRPEEKISPKITLGTIPDHEQFETVLINPQITDQSGIKKVQLTIKNPNNKVLRQELTMSTNNYYPYEYTDTSIIGTYNLTITAWDNSIYSEQTAATINRLFRIIPDQTPPTFEYSGVSPATQLPEKNLLFTCIISDLTEIKTVMLTIEDYNGTIEQHSMSKTTNKGKYTFTTSYELVGKYTYTISAEDKEKNPATTEEKHFWITPDLNDTDNDGIPDWWEAKYGLDLHNPTDAENDNDNDGYTNIEEYKRGTNPLKSVASISELLKNLEQNSAYLAASLIFFIVLVLLAIYFYRRQ